MNHGTCAQWVTLSNHKEPAEVACSTLGGAHMNLPNERNQTQKATDCAVNVFDIWKRQDQSNGEKKSVCQEFGLEGWGSGQRAGLERNRMTVWEDDRTLP